MGMRPPLTTDSIRTADTETPAPHHLELFYHYRVRSSKSRAMKPTKIFPSVKGERRRASTAASGAGGARHVAEGLLNSSNKKSCTRRNYSDLMVGLPEASVGPSCVTSSLPRAVLGGS